MKASFWRATSTFAIAAVVVMVCWHALTPLPDWHNAPIRLFPLRFRPLLGHFGSDTIRHVLGAALLPPLLVRISGLPRTRFVAQLIVGCVLAGGLLLELVQGFLPYRNCELTDIVSNLVGSGMALLILHRMRHRAPAPPSQPAPTNTTPQV